MKVLGPARPHLGMSALAQDGGAAATSGPIGFRLESNADDMRADFATFYERWLGQVVRLVRALGAPDRDVEDVAQNVFLVVQRKLGTFDGPNPEPWLFRIVQRQVKDYARRAWFRHLFSRQQDLSSSCLADLCEPGLGPAELAERAEARRIVQRALSQMSEKQRVVFALYELEGFDGQHIATVLGIPIATVWTRLFHARRDFAERLRALGLASEDVR